MKSTTKTKIPSNKKRKNRSRMLNGLQVLVVDDHLPSAKLLNVVLTAAGCVVKVCKDAGHALRALKSFDAQVLLVDLILPDMDGIFLSNKIKTNPATKNIIIFIVTAASEYGLEQTALQIGCAAYIKKPIDALTFPKLMLRHVRRHNE